MIGTSLSIHTAISHIDTMYRSLYSSRRLIFMYNPNTPSKTYSMLEDLITGVTIEVYKFDHWFKLIQIGASLSHCTNNNRETTTPRYKKKRIILWIKGARVGTRLVTPLSTPPSLVSTGLTEVRRKQFKCTWGEVWEVSNSHGSLIWSHNATTMRKNWENPPDPSQPLHP